MRHRSRFAAIAVASLLLGLLPTAATADDQVAGPDEGIGSDNMDFVANLQFPTDDRPDNGSFAATDMDFASYRMNSAGKLLPPNARGGSERDFAFVGTALNGLQVVDITDPENPERVAVYDCRVSQADVFTFEQGDRTLVAYSLDAVSQNSPEGSDCHEDNGITDSGERGTFIVDVTDPYNPESVSFLPMRKGSHQVTVHPSGEFVYNSAAVVVTTRPGSIEVYDIRTPEEPELVDEIELLTGLDSHDLTFNEDGTRLYSAAITHSFVIDTSDPTDNQIVGRIFDPAINIHHDAHKVTVDGALGERDYMLIGDELAGAAASGYCPGGGVHVYDITGPLEAAPVKVGAFFMPEVRPAGFGGDTGEDLTCTAHVLRIHPDEELITMAWYNGGVRVLDYSGLGDLGGAGLQVGVGGESLTPGIQEVGHYRFPDSSLWSAKVHEIADDGSMYIFGGDINRAFDVYHFDADADGSAERGQFVDPDTATAKALTESSVAAPGNDYATACLLIGAEGA
jgi:hypothetical protein